MNDFDDVKVGDKIFIDQGRYGAMDCHVLEVTRVTKTQFVAGGRSYKKDRGLRIGDSTWHRVYAYPYDPAKHDAQVAKQEILRARARLINRLEDIRRLKLTDDQIKRIVAILDEVSP